MYKVLIIGAGGVGRRHIKSYIATNKAIISIVEPDAEKCKAVEKDFQISKVYCFPEFELIIPRDR